MSNPDPVQQSIHISTGVNAAATLAAGTADPAGYFLEILPAVVGGVLDVHAQFGDVTGAQPVTEQQAVANVAAAFPGTQVVPPAQAANVFPPQQHQPYVPQQPAVSAPAPIPGVADGDPETAAYWMEFFSDLQQTGSLERWFDNRFTKQNPQGPDFKKKGKENSNKALWRVSKKNPAWVAGALQQAGLA